MSWGYFLKCDDLGWNSSPSWIFKWKIDFLMQYCLFYGQGSRTIVNSIVYSNWLNFWWWLQITATMQERLKNAEMLWFLVEFDELVYWNSLKNGEETILEVLFHRTKFKIVKKIGKAVNQASSQEKWDCSLSKAENLNDFFLFEGWPFMTKNETTVVFNKVVQSNRVFMYERRFVLRFFFWKNGLKGERKRVKRREEEG
jgi:hypothetical protein